MIGGIIHGTVHGVPVKGLRTENGVFVTSIEYRPPGWRYTYTWAPNAIQHSPAVYRKEGELLIAVYGEYVLDDVTV